MIDDDDERVDVFARFVPENGNVRGELGYGDRAKVRFLVSPRKVRIVAAAMLAAADEAEAQMPRIG